ncbi:MAG TPA: YihY/virulence factor BrkB family protein [Dehalococcoidia bacterium]|nr:YihY/virulence factor BrkB family protein [Dehalococcoidia bacterium]
MQDSRANQGRQPAASDKNPLIRRGVDTALPEARIGPVRLKSITSEALENAAEHDLLGLAAEIAYRSALTILPFVLLIAALPSVMGPIFGLPDVPGALTGEADAVLSKNSATMVHTLIDEVSRSQGWSAVFLGLSGTLLAGVSAMSTVRKALNRVYALDEQPSIIGRKLLDIILTLTVGVLLIAATACLLVGPIYLKHDGLGIAASGVGGALFVLLAVSIIYWQAPNADASYRWVTPGSLLFVVGWLIFSLGFSAYLSRFGTINRVYGSLGVMIGLLIWLYGSNIAFLFGAEVNAALARRFDADVEGASKEQARP